MSKQINHVDTLDALAHISSKIDAAMRGVVGVIFIMSSIFLTYSGDISFGTIFTLMIAGKILLFSSLISGLPTINRVLKIRRLERRAAQLAVKARKLKSRSEEK